MDVLIQTGLLTISLLVVYLIFFKRKAEQQHGLYVEPDWTYPFYKFYIKFYIRYWKKAFVHRYREIESQNQPQGYENIQLRASARDSTNILLRIRKLYGEDTIVEVTVHLQLPDGTCYKLPRHPDTAIGHWYSDNNVWKAGGLKIEVVHPWKMLRVLYNGMLVRTDNNAVHHVRLNLLWISASELVYHPEDWHESIAAAAIARTQDLRDIGRRGEDGIFQWCCAQGWFQVQESIDVPPKKIWLRARGLTEKSHSLEKLDELRRSVSLMVISRNGTGVHLRAHSYKDGPDQVFSGSVRDPNSNVNVLKCTDLQLAHFCETRDEIPKKYILHVQTDNKTVKVTIIIGNSGGELRSGVPYAQDIVYRTILAEVDGDPAVGILELGYEPSEIRPPTVKLSPRPSLYWSDAKDTSYCVGFNSTVATCMSLVGGKGASLALLATVQEKEGYKVPPGFCLTINAFEQHMKDNLDILKCIKAIESASVDYDEQNFKDKCQKAVETIKSTKIAGHLKDEILLYLKETRTAALEQKIYKDIRFAVRSSAVGEDSEALSAAGQNETVLGCVTETDVLDGVLRCWGSMFAFTSAQYRRQNGQPCMTGAGVVIQTLVPPRAAGVLFSRHPQAGDPSRVLITANYGLGESVVSGSVEPDTIVVARNLNDELSISSVVLGAKKELITTTESGITSKAVPEEERNVACISNSEALKLAEIAVSQEYLWGAPRDIEWAINQDGIFLLQARPITSLEMWSEEELLHENDDAVMSDEDLITFANTGEVLPKPVTPLSYSLLIKPLNMSMNKSLIGSKNSFNFGMGMTHYRSYLNMYNIMYRNVGKKLNLTLRMVEMSINGHPVADERIHAIAVKRYPSLWINQLFGIWTMLKTMILSSWAVKHTKKLVKEYSIDKIDTDDTQDMFNRIRDSRDVVEKIVQGHLYTTSASSASQIVIMTILMGNNTEFTNDHYSDLAMMLRCGEAVSAELPTILTKFSRTLVQSGKIDEFKTQSPETALDWIKKNLPALYQEIVLLLESHGHRAIMELDLSTVPWAIDPTGLIKILQNMHITDDVKGVSTMTDDEIISSLTTVPPNKRKILRWLLSICRNMVSKRECTKSEMIYGFHKMRLAVRKLGQLMVRDWLIPNMELIYFFSAYELQKFIKTRDPALLRKATQRRQYFPKWGKLKFAEVIEGWPEPLKVEDRPLVAEGAKIQATPVCAGEIVARACVVPDLSEIEQLVQGDVLITHSTDIGWSPYFPMISGIVTELGGLISHGAVIARECGLPCIVGATGATMQFRTGDIVRLSGSTGILEKIKTT